MLNLFEPQLKVQKNRQIIRQTDTRMAKYSRRGIISTCLIYILCVVFEPEFYQQHPNLTLVLTAGLLATAFLRGYLLFRFETIYPRAPHAWRNKYFVATLMGSAWWGLIVGSFTLTLDLTGMASLLWLYTVVFFSITAHAFAPYQKFLSIYQFVGIIPAACTTFFIGELTGACYGLILLMFYWILSHHCELIARNYWEQLEVSSNLSRRAESLEEERRDTRASVSLNREFLSLLDEQLQGLLRQLESTEAPRDPVGQLAVDSLGSMTQQVRDFRRVLNKELACEERAFNVCHFLRQIGAQWVEPAERKGVDLETAFSPAMPVHLQGDAIRLGQIVAIMLRNTIMQTSEGLVFVEVEYIREFGNLGELHVTLVRQLPAAKRGFFTDQGRPPIEASLDLVLARGLAEIMGGELEVGGSEVREGKCLRLRVQMNVAPGSPEIDYAHQAHKGRNILLIHPHARWLDNKRLELSLLGFHVETSTSFKKGMKMLLAALSEGKAIGSVMYSILPGDTAPIQFCNDLLEHQELKYTHHFVVASAPLQKYFSDRLSRETSLIHFVQKPTSIFEFEIAMSSVFDGLPAQMSDGGNTAAVPVLWIATGKAVNESAISESQSMLITRIGDAKQLPKQLEEQEFGLYVIEYTGDQELQCIQTIREFYLENPQRVVRPILGIGPAEAQLTMLQYGVDYFIEIECLVRGDMRALRHWLRGWA